jgi:hypothetical protein
MHARTFVEECMFLGVITGVVVDDMSFAPASSFNHLERTKFM